MIDLTECEKCGRMMDGPKTVCVPCEPQEWRKGGNAGRITWQGGNNKYLAVTATASGWYKTYRGAANFMERRGYTEA